MVVLPLLLVAIGGGLVYFNLLSQTEREANTHIQSVTKLLANRTSSFIQNSGHAVTLLAGEALLKQHLHIAQHNPASYQQVNNLLQRYCTTLNASICYVMNREGITVADNRPENATLIGNNYAFRPYFQQAIQGLPSVHLALGVTTKKRGIYFSSPIYSDVGNISGVAIIKYPPDQIEQQFAGLSGYASLVNHLNVVFASNQPNWLYKTLFPLSKVQLEQIAESRQFGDSPPESLGFKLQSNNQALAPNNSSYLLERMSIPELPGWQITYLLAPENLHTQDQKNQHQGALVLLGLLFILTLFAVHQLYRKLHTAIQSNTRNQHKLEESEGRLQRFEKVSSEAIFIHNVYGIVDVNKRAEELFGYSHEELLKLTPHDFFSPDSIEIALKHVREKSETPYQASIITKQGEEIPVVVTGRLVSWNGLKARAASFRDIRKRVAVQKKLMASESRFRQLSDLVAEGLLIHSEEKIIDVNQSLCEIIGEIRDELIDTPIQNIFSPEALDKIHRSQLSEAFEVELSRKDGTRFPAEISSASMQFEDGLYTVLAIRDISRQKEQEEHILYQAQYDLLTHIPNRFLARDRAEQAMKNADRHKTKLALMFVDLDGFKKVNDSLGHDVGDHLLQQATKRFQNCLEDGHTLARHGGDEFIILLEDLSSPTEAELVAERILEQFSNPFSIQGKQLIVTSSIGISIYPDDAENYRALLRSADIGMYKAKKEGRNRFHYYTQEMNDIASRQLELDNNLRNAIANGELSLVYQPLISGTARKGTISGAEALVRWNSPTLGPVAPTEFIPLTEQTGLILSIGRWVLEQACLQAKQWIKDSPDDFAISVNVSPRQFKGNDFLKDLKRALEISQLPPEHLKLEVTEGLLIEASQELNDTLTAISELGVRISMDDFGTGYSSLNYLKTFPFENLKIDRSFISELPNSADAKILVTATIAMAHQLGLSVTAEGIESDEQHAFLQELKCDYLQGYYLGKPMPAHQFSERLSQQKN